MTVYMVTAPPMTEVFSRQYIDKVDKLILIFWHLIETYMTPISKIRIQIS